MLRAYSLNQTDNASKLSNLGTKPTSNGNGVNNLMKLNNNSNGSLNETNGKAVNIDEVRLVFVYCMCVNSDRGYQYVALF